MWPMVWPTPYAMTTTLQLGGDNGSRLTLPLVPPSLYAAPVFAPPEPNVERTDIQDVGYLGREIGKPSATRSTEPRK